MAEALRDSLSVTFTNCEEETDPTALYNLSYGLFVISAREGDKDNGCIANTCFQVSSTEPTKIVISSQMGNLTREMIERTGVFNASILTESTPFELIRHFGMQSGRDTDKFSDFTGKDRSANGVYYLTDYTNTVLSCKVTDKINLGSHMMFVCDITSSKVLSDEPSCTYAYYHKAIKPKL